VGASVVAGVGTPVESFEGCPAEQVPALHLRMLGPMAVVRDGVALKLPASRKVRALIAYLALSARAPTRDHLCQLFGDIPSDPRGEIRWCLSKARAVLDDAGRRRITTSGDTVGVDLSDCFVDVVEINRTMNLGIAKLGPEQLRELSDLFVGEFLEGLEMDRCPAFSGWLLAQRRRLRACRVAVLEQLAGGHEVPSDDTLGYLEQWLQLAPFDRRAHELMLEEFGQRGQIREGDEHLAATARAFESDGLDCRRLRDAWRDAKARHAGGSVAEVRADATAISTLPSSLEPTAVTSRRASIVVMPFVEQVADSAARAMLAGGLAHDIITRLAKLRSLFVIAQGTVFALHERSIGAEEAGRTLNVDFVVSGSLRRLGQRIVVNVELTETRTARVVWAEAFDHLLDDAFLVLDEIGNRIVSSIASEIESVERERAILKQPNSLDAWEAHHRGLWHMYRFNRADNERARHYFELAVRLDRTFSRAYAGLSFTHFQNAFQGWTERERETERAFETARQSLAVDDRDPAAHWSMGRALWLRGRQDQALAELNTTVNLSPNFALGHYTLAFVHSQSGDPQVAIEASDHSRLLSPFDPLLFGMLATRAMALVRLGRFDEAAEWATKAAARPNAHAHILAIAVHCLALAGRLEEAQSFNAVIHKTLPHYCTDDFLAAFRFAPDAVTLFRVGGERVGLE
jgi:TolB-like protein/DNA-binding SARP family transcriptional activator/Tfp pilus assembly protein PilF